MPHTPPPLTDAQAIRRVLDGESGAFAVLVERHSPAVFALLARHLPLAEQEELAQESFLLAFERLSTLTAPESFQPWLLALTQRRCARALRRAAARREFSLECAGPGGPNRTGGPDGAGAEEHRSWLRACLLEESRQRQEAVVRERENKSLLARLMAHLKPEDRTALGLFYAMDHTLCDIAAMLGWSEVKVKVRLHRAKKSMAHKMRALQPEEGAGW